VVDGATSATIYTGRFSAGYGATSFHATELCAGLLSGADVIGGVAIGKGLLLYSGSGLASATPGSTQLTIALRAYPIATSAGEQCGPLRPGGPLVECPAWVSPPVGLTTRSAPVVDPLADRVHPGADGRQALRRRRQGHGGRRGGRLRRADLRAAVGQRFAALGRAGAGLGSSRR